MSRAFPVPLVTSTANIVSSLGERRIGRLSVDAPMGAPSTVAFTRTPPA